MLPPPSSPGPPAEGAASPEKQRAGLAVLLVALAVLLGLIALVWWVNEREHDADPWRSAAGRAWPLGAPT